MRLITTYFICLFMFCVTAIAGVDPSNKLKLGDGTDSDKILEANKGSGSSNPKLKFESATQKWRIANDGVTFTDIGSGSGGSSGAGVNFLTSGDNPGFEDGTSSWTASGGSFTTDLVTPLFGTISGVFDASALNQTLTSALKAVPIGSRSKDCLSIISYKYAGTSGDYNLQVTDGTSVLTEVALATAASPVEKYLDFTCPASGSVNVRLIAKVSNPGAITIDGAAISSGLVYLGSRIGTGFDVSWTGFHGNDCTWTFNTNSFVDPSSGDSSCTFTELYNGNFGTVTSFTISGNNGPGIVFTPARTGRYLVCSTTNFNADANTSAIQLVDGDGNILNSSAQNNTQKLDTATLCGVISVSGAIVSKTLKIQGKTAGTFIVGGGAPAGRSIDWTVTLMK